MSITRSMSPSELHWRKSSYSTNEGGECVEVAALADAVAVRDSKNPDGPHLTFPTTAFTRLVRSLAPGR